MRWETVLGMASVVVSLSTLGGLAGSREPVYAASAVPAAATSQPRFIREAQRTLGEMGYHPGPIDGVVGRRTQSALARYQRSEGIPVTGRLDAETLVRLDIHQRVAPASNRRESELGPTSEVHPARATVARR